MKGKIIIFIVVGIIVIVVAAAIISMQLKKVQSGQDPSTTGGQNQASVGAAYNLDLSITLPKTSYSVGEKVSYEGVRPEYISKNLGKSFSSYSIYSCKREGYPITCSGGATGTGMKSPNLDFSYAAMACRIYNTHSLCLSDSYDEAGTYIYELFVYDCADIKDALGVSSCSGLSAADVLSSSAQPVGSTSKTIVVS